MASDSDTEAIRRAYIEAWRRILREQEAIADDPKAFRRAARLKEMGARIALILDQLDALTSQWIRDEFPRIYGRGLRDAARQMGGSWTFTQVDEEAVRLLAQDLFNDLLKATRGVRRDTKRLIRDIVREELLTARIKGEPLALVRRRVRRYLLNNGIRAVKYANGVWQSLDTYAEMALRTKSAMASNTAHLSHGKQNKVKFYEILDGPNCGLSFHEDPTLALGMIVNFNTAMKYRIAHPNCRRAFASRPDIKTAKEAKTAKPSVSEETLVAMREAENAALAKRANSRNPGRRAAARREQRLAERRRILEERRQRRRVRT